jgi:N-acetylglucosaminyl-diphospho-decaprenol L-rhamnosyltransferase
MKPKDLSIVIVTFKSESKIFNCLNSIPSDHDVIVVENSNNLNFKSDIEKKYVNVKCFLTGTNKGYAIANNIGLKNVKTKYALVLNPDTIVEKNAIENFLITADKFKDFWLIGPANDQSVNYEFQEKEVKEVDNLKGFAIFFNLSKFNSNFFDENFFLYFEEIDLCKNVKKNNGKIYLDKNISINHEGGSSVDKSNSLELEKNRNWHWMWSTFYFNKKYRGFLLAFIFIFPKLISSILKTIFYQLIFNKEKKIIYFYRLSGILNSILGKKSWHRPSLD